MRGSTVERLYREVRALRIYEGTSEIQKLVIARHMLKESREKGSYDDGTHRGSVRRDRGGGGGGAEGLVLSPDVWDRLREEWKDEDIEDALGLVHDSLLQGELVESADSLSARLVEVLGAYGDAAPSREVEAGEAALIGSTCIGQLARRVARLEEVLEAYRDGRAPDRTRLRRAAATAWPSTGSRRSWTRPTPSARGPSSGDDEDDEER